MRRFNIFLALIILSPVSAIGMKLGDGEKYIAMQRQAKDLPLGSSWIYRKISPETISFGDPVHEDMTRASIALAQSKVGGACSPTPQQLSDFFAPPASSNVSSEMCCSKSADSTWCDKLGTVRHARFNGGLPLIVGTRWNDDPCHMTLRSGMPLVSWAAWMLDSRYMASSNLNYASHYHEKQFLHAMAPNGRKDPSSYRETAEDTKKKIMAWAEFSFKVSTGDISPTVTIQKVRDLLTPENRRAFELSFGISKSLTVGFLFTGTSNPDALQVRQMAIGALLHTVQDSFSSSHVQREQDAHSASGAPLVSNKGNVVRFLTYRLQDSHLHGVADKRPADTSDVSAGPDHPVAIGADLLTCAATSDTPAASWERAREVVDRTFTLSNPSLRASGGAYARQIVKKSGPR